MARSGNTGECPDGKRKQRARAKLDPARSVPRRFFKFCTLLSLLLCVAVCVLWARSYWLSDKVEWRNASGSRSVQSKQGHIVVRLLMADQSGHPERFHGPRHQSEVARRSNYWRWDLDGDLGETFASWDWGGFEWYEKRNSRLGTLHAVAVAPFWSFATVAAILPSAWMITRLRSYFREYRRKRSGLCPTCGYDLRASSERCPECGAVKVG